MDFPSDGRWGGSSRVNEGMGVNRPSVTAPRPDHGGEICATRNLAEEKGKKGSVERGEERRARMTEITEENREKLEKYREF
jgi:hypothetical protein